MSAQVIQLFPKGDQSPAERWRHALDSRLWCGAEYCELQAGHWRALARLCLHEGQEGMAPYCEANAEALAKAGELPWWRAGCERLRAAWGPACLTW